jgi:hypothetical protein
MSIGSLLDRLLDGLGEKNVVTLVFVIYAVVGGVLAIINPETLSFEEYSTRLVVFGGAVGIGKGILNGQKARAEGTAPPELPHPDDYRVGEGEDAADG